VGAASATVAMSIPFAAQRRFPPPASRLASDDRRSKDSSAFDPVSNDDLISAGVGPGGRACPSVGSHEITDRVADVASPFREGGRSSECWHCVTAKSYDEHTRPLLGDAEILCLHANDLNSIARLSKVP
jgi:hypothetical protein